MEKTKGGLFGKIWYACGDSFTHGDFTGITPPTIKDGKVCRTACRVSAFLSATRTCAKFIILLRTAPQSQPSDSSFDQGIHLSQLQDCSIQPIFRMPITSRFTTASMTVNKATASSGNINDNENTTFSTERVECCAGLSDDKLPCFAHQLK